jgi:hypothetical protein
LPLGNTHFLGDFVRAAQSVFDPLTKDIQAGSGPGGNFNHAIPVSNKPPFNCSLLEHAVAVFGKPGDEARPFLCSSSISSSRITQNAASSRRDVPRMVFVFLPEWWTSTTAIRWRRKVRSHWRTHSHESASFSATPEKRHERLSSTRTLIFIATSNSVMTSCVTASPRFGQPASNRSAFELSDRISVDVELAENINDLQPRVFLAPPVSCGSFVRSSRLSQPLYDTRFPTRRLSIECNCAIKFSLDT